MNPIKWCIDKINQEPRYINELIRLYAKETRKHPEEVEEAVLKAIAFVTKAKGFETVEYWTDIGSIVWNNYKIIYNPNHMAEDYKKRLEKKIKKIKRISEIGKLNAKMYENAVYRAVKKIYPDAEQSDFNSVMPDVIVRSKKLIFEASARFENPIDYDYVFRKLNRWRAYFDKEYLIVFISPNITKSALDLINKSQKMTDWELDKELILRAKWIQYPKKSKSHEGFPIFRRYKYYVKYMRDVGRKITLLSSKQMVEDLIPILKNIR